MLIAKLNVEFTDSKSGAKCTRDYFVKYDLRKAAIAKLTGMPNVRVAGWSTVKALEPEALVNIVRAARS